MLVQAILIGLIAAFGKLDYQLGTLYAFRPIVLCPLVGLVLGDLQSGLAIGASLELLFMGSISIGAFWSTAPTSLPARVTSRASTPCTGLSAS